MNILRYLKSKKLKNPADQYALNVALKELELYHKRLAGLIDDPNCRANKAKARDLIVKNEI